MELDGIYKSCSKYGPQVMADDRKVYIRDNRVQLVNDQLNDTQLGPFVYGYDNFFHVNNLGERVGNIPENFIFGKNSNLGD